MNTPQRNDTGQRALWNDSAGRAWVEMQAVLDQVLKPFQDLLLDEVRATGESGPLREVLDIGCGAGSTTLAVARELGPKGRCVGVDISEPLVAAARARAVSEGSAGSFIHADAQEYPFEAESFDCVISRFGVMFFDDPVRAFANLRRAAKAGGALRCIAWRSAAENPFMTTAERAAAPLLQNLPARQPNAPGQFALGDRSRIATILAESGWTEVEIQPVDVLCTLLEKDLTGYLTRLGPVGIALKELDDRTRSQVVEAVRAAFEPYVTGAEVRFTAACWMVRARRIPDRT
ncbi:MAG TPA: class I SAM-dependent methyltransferase [Steroidobacteraceae bacterium]|jgi:SAM-dependent methyltransferase